MIAPNAMIVNPGVLSVDLVFMLIGLVFWFKKIPRDSVGKFPYRG